MIRLRVFRRSDQTWQSLELVSSGWAWRMTTVLRAGGIGLADLASWFFANRKEVPRMKLISSKAKKCSMSDLLDVNL